jgi:hypothetical protein
LKTAIRAARRHTGAFSIGFYKTEFDEASDFTSGIKVFGSTGLVQ